VIASWAIWLIVALAVIGIAYVAAQAMGVPIPDWVWKIIGIIIVAVVAVVAIKFLVSVV
jgi:hypothetical protein